MKLAVNDAQTTPNEQTYLFLSNFGSLGPGDADSALHTVIGGDGCTIVPNRAVGEIIDTLHPERIFQLHTHPLGVGATSIPPSLTDIETLIEQENSFEVSGTDIIGVVADASGVWHYSVPYESAFNQMLVVNQKLESEFFALPVVTDYFYEVDISREDLFDLAAKGNLGQEAQDKVKEIDQNLAPYYKFYEQDQRIPAAKNTAEAQAILDERLALERDLGIFVERLDLTSCIEP
ncbi:hypothetical protein L0Y41_00750 [bacterium]|nr:hypothetical protein [bacterium]